MVLPSEICSLLKTRVECNLYEFGTSRVHLWMMNKSSTLSPSSSIPQRVCPLSKLTMRYVGVDIPRMKGVEGIKKYGFVLNATNGIQSSFFRLDTQPLRPRPHQMSVLTLATLCFTLRVNPGLAREGSSFGGERRKGWLGLGQNSYQKQIHLFLEVSATRISLQNSPHIPMRALLIQRTGK